MNKDKFRNKYRIKSARHPNWDYANNAAYFVTICTQNRECYFGEITKGKMKFSDIGKIAFDCWIEIPKHFPFVKLDAFVIMPNHVHGIVIIDKPVEMQNLASQNNRRNNECIIETQNFASLRIPKNKFGPQSKNLSSIIRGFKIGVTKNARQINVGFAWQSRFHDRIIRNNNEFKNIGRYICNNPGNWANSKMNEF